MLTYQHCSRCIHWRPFCEDGQQETLGTCRLIAFPPTFTAWLLTEAGDWCDEWSGPTLECKSIGKTGANVTHERALHFRPEQSFEAPLIVNVPGSALTFR